MKRVTSTDIAQLAGVSQATVSYVISDCWREKGIRPETRERILAVARKAGYRRNRLARGLKVGKTHVIGIVVPCVTFPFFSEIVRGVEDAASHRGYIVILTHTDEDAGVQKRKLDTLLSYSVDGVLMIPAVVRPGEKPLEGLVGVETRVVLVDKTVPGLDLPFVGTDDVRGAFEATEYLIRLGHRRIAHLRGPAGASTAVERLEGYRQALRAHGLPVEEGLIVGEEWREAAGRRATAELLRLDPPPTAVFACTDVLAWAAYAVFRERGVIVPRDMSVVGYADLEPSARLEVPLTTVRQPAREMGRRAAEMLLEMIEKGAIEQRQVRLPVELVVRNSCAPPRESPDTHA